MDPTKDILQGKWPELKGQVQQQWSSLTDEDIAELSGKAEELADVLQQRYRYGRVEADMEIRNWLRHHGKANGVKA
ncbi:MAG TPA: CsbD family protein [Anaerolineae bacterium]